jgi:hypothetical protein
MWIKIKDPSGEHLIQTSFDVAVGGDGDYAFMNEWDIQRIRAYCRERSLTLEENVEVKVKTPPVIPNLEELFKSITYKDAGVTGLTPEGVYGREEELINHVRDALNYGESSESVSYKIMRGIALKYVPQNFRGTLDRFIEVLTCPLNNVPLYLNDPYPVKDIAKKRLSMPR